jgi:hypothetical protein
MTDKHMPLLIGSTAALIIMVCLAMILALTTFYFLRVVLCH